MCRCTFCCGTAAGTAAFSCAASVEHNQLIGNDLWSVIMRRRAELSLSAAEAQTRQIIESSADGILQLDATGQIALANPAACAMLGLAPEQLLGRAVHTAIYPPPDDVNAAQRATSGILAAIRDGRNQ